MTRKEALQSLNAQYGKGDITQVRFYLDGKCTVIVHKQYGLQEYVFHDNGRTVRMHGHQLTYKGR